MAPYRSKDRVMDIKISLPHVSLDVAAISAAVGVVLGWVPQIAAVFSLVWVLIKIYETATVQSYLANRRIRIRGRKLAHLHAREKVILAEIDAIERVRVAKAYAQEKTLEARTDAARELVVEQTSHAVDLLKTQS